MANLFIGWACFLATLAFWLTKKDWLQTAWFKKPRWLAISAAVRLVIYSGESTQVFSGSPI